MKSKKHKKKKEGLNSINFWMDFFEISKETLQSFSDQVRLEAQNSFCKARSSVGAGK